MKVHNTNLSPQDAIDEWGRNQTPRGASHAANDDVHLSELVQSLRSLAEGSPDRQERLEQIARAYANGTYTLDAEATAGRMIDDALQYP